MSRDTRNVLRAVASYGLSGSLISLPQGPFEDRTWSSLLATAVREGLQGPLAWAVANGDVPATAAQGERAAALHTAAMTVCLRHERLLVEVIGRLRSADIPVRVLTGAALAHTAYGDATLRTFRDIDLLVRPQDAQLVRALLGDLGLRPEGPDRAGEPGASRLDVLRDDHGLTIDLHTTIGTSGPPSDAERDLFADGSTFELAGRPAPTLTPDQHLLHACFAAGSDPEPRWSRLRDIAQLVLTTDLELGTILDLAGRWSGTPAVARAVARTWEEFELADRVPLSEWAVRAGTANGEREPGSETPVRRRITETVGRISTRLRAFGGAGPTVAATGDGARHRAQGGR